MFSMPLRIHRAVRTTLNPSFKFETFLNRTFLVRTFLNRTVLVRTFLISDDVIGTTKITSTYLYTCRAPKLCSRLKSWKKASRDFFFSLVTNLNFYGNIQQWLLFHLKGLQTLIAAIRNVFLERSFFKFQSFYDDFFLLLPSRAFLTLHAVVVG